MTSMTSTTFSTGTARTESPTLSMTIGRMMTRLLTWQERSAQRRRLLEMDSRMLADIGVTRADAEMEASKPFWR